MLEDSAFDVDLITETLKSYLPDVQTKHVNSEQGFLDALRLQRYDAILSDFEIPGFGGAQALEIVRHSGIDTPFIFVSGVIGEDNAVELMKMGATDYVSKSRLARLPLVLDRALKESSTRRGRADAERKLREADATYGRLVESLTDYAVILVDDEGRIEGWNAGAQATFGYGRDEMLGQSLELLMSSIDVASRGLQRDLAATRKMGRLRTARWMVRRDSAPLWAVGSLSTLPSEQGESHGFFCILRDTTAEFVAEENMRNARLQAEAARDEAQRAIHARDRFIAVLSHELRTPLSSISFAAHLLEKVATVPDKYEHLLPMVRRNIAIEARLIDDLLDVSAISNGKLNLKPDLVDMHELLQETVDLFDDQIIERQLTLSLQIADAPAVVNADRVRMQQVISNLLRNAVKFSNPGGHITLRTEVRGQQFTLSCRDEGVGIAAQDIERIFRPFEQGAASDGDGAQKRGGLGLGLAIASHLVAMHGGELDAASDGPGKGATFTLRMPCTTRAADAATSPVQADGSHGGGNGHGSFRVLLVEDNVSAAWALQMCLESYDYAVVHAATVAEAMLAFQESDFDIVLTDLGLPDGSGVEIGRALSKTVPVVALSGYGAEADRRRTLEAGFSAHIVKPADPEQVHAMLQQVLSTTPQAPSRPH
ncbi:hybrid sensor histidine kinase/response regulator [Uliginosibacterium sp. H1]|uniref:hybrid sensor histidine kinase/response regulator n=1 Tax=Uliginosibacterium sp. H1 TaxID=3114757 RepID=UPI002E196D59|nr:response regulator [Uliginosibacterium sp. H1]